MNLLLQTTYDSTQTSKQEVVNLANILPVHAGFPPPRPLRVRTKTLPSFPTVFVLVPFMNPSMAYPPRPRPHRPSLVGVLQTLVLGADHRGRVENTRDSCGAASDEAAKAALAAKAAAKQKASQASSSSLVSIMVLVALIAIAVGYYQTIILKA